MIWEKLAKEFLVTGTVGDLICIAFGGFLVGVFLTTAFFQICKLKKQEKKKIGDKITSLILISMLTLISGGCASMQAEIIRDPGRVDSIAVGHFTTANPVDDELIGSYLRTELTRRGIVVSDDSAYVLTGTIDVDQTHYSASAVVEARIVLKEYSDRIIWIYHTGWFIAPDRKEFASMIANKISRQLK